MLAKTILYLHHESIYHGRKIYEFVTLLGDLGGVAGVLTLIFGFFLEPLSESSFMIMSAKRLFLASTKNDKLFIINEKDKQKL